MYNYEIQCPGHGTEFEAFLIRYRISGDKYDLILNMFFLYRLTAVCHPYKYINNFNSILVKTKGKLSLSSIELNMYSILENLLYYSVHCILGVRKNCMHYK